MAPGARSRGGRGGAVMLRIDCCRVQAMRHGTGYVNGSTPESRDCSLLTLLVTDSEEVSMGTLADAVMEAQVGRCRIV